MWTGAGSPNTGWAVADNWSGGTLPTNASAAGSAADNILIDDTYTAVPSRLTLARPAGFGVETLMWNSTAAGTTPYFICTSSASNNAVAFDGDQNGGTTPLFTLGPRAASGVTLVISNGNTGIGNTGKIVLQLNTSGAFCISSADATLQVDTVIQEARGARTLETNGAGTLRLTNTNTNTNTNTFTGGVVMSGGVLALGTVPALSPANLTLNGGTLRATAGFTRQRRRRQN